MFLYARAAAPTPITQGQNAVFSLRLDDVSKVFVVEPKQVVGSSQVSIRVANGTLDYENPNQRKFIVLVSGIAFCYCCCENLGKCNDNNNLFNLCPPANLGNC